ncbi:type II secretion system protein [Campylobacterota bacterium]
MRKAYTLLELIFIIVIIGVLAGVASTTYKPDYLKSDINYITLKIKKAQYSGIGYEHKVFGTDDAPADYINGCIKLNKTDLEDKATDGKAAYKLNAEFEDAGTLCFDAKGRPHTDDFNGLPWSKVIDLSYNGETKSITISAVSGFVSTSCN